MQRIHYPNLWSVGENISEERCNGDVAVVWSFRAFARDICFDWLPGLITVIRSLMHMDSFNVVRSAPQVEVHAPESRTEGVRKAWSTFVVQRISFSQNQWKIWV